MALEVKDLFFKMDESVSILRKELGISYLDSIIETGENILDNGNIRVERNLLSDEPRSELKTIYKDMKIDEYSSEEVRRALQFLLIKAIKEDHVQPNHQMTPDSIGTFIAYLIEIITDIGEEPLHLADFSVGTGNLLQTVYYFLNNKDRNIQLSGVDNDEVLISVASTSSALQGLDVQLIHNDALQNLLVEPVDVMVSDLPVGYYPVDNHASKFQTSNEEGHSFSHYLLIEQSINYLKDGGLGFYLVPTNIFDSEEGAQLLSYIQEVGYFQGFIHLSKEMFKTEQSRKSVLIIQKQGAGAKQAKEVLLANAPEFNDADEMKNFIGELNVWKNSQFD